MKKTIDTRKLVILSVLVALQIVLTRFCSINAWNTRIGLGYIAVAVSGMLFGPVSSALVGAVADFLGAVLFPSGSYFPGFTLTAALMGASFGFFLKKAPTVPGILGSIAVNQLILSLLLNTLWISILYSSSFTGLLSTRFLQMLVSAPVQFISIYIIATVYQRSGIRQAIMGA